MAWGISKWVVRSSGPGLAAGDVAALIEHEVNVEGTIDIYPARALPSRQLRRISHWLLSA